jgi:DNA-binding LacI/PurR family transcriptional regulator
VTSPYWMPASSISMVEQPVIQMADASVQLLFDQLEKVVPAESVMLQPLFSAGESSAPLKRPLRRASGKP